MASDVFRLGEYPGHLWSTEDCVDVTLIWLQQRRDRLDDAIAKIEAVRPEGAGSLIKGVRNASIK